LGLSKVMIGDWGYKMGFIADIKDQPYINHQASGDNILLATLDAMTTALADKQNKDTTLTSLSGKSIAELRTYLELKSAALRDIGTGANQIPDMSVQGFGSNWIKTVGGMIIQKGSVLIPTGQNYATTAFPIPFLSGGVVNLTWSDTPSNTGTTSNITYGVVVGSNLNTGFQAWMAGAGGYNLTYIAIGY
ncbi:gp53-like domain-containing protein, partial [Citrobacter freundii]